MNGKQLMRSSSSQNFISDYFFRCMYAEGTSVKNTISSPGHRSFRADLHRTIHFKWVCVQKNSIKLFGITFEFITENDAAPNSFSVILRIIFHFTYKSWQLQKKHKLTSMHHASEECNLPLSLRIKTKTINLWKLLTNRARMQIEWVFFVCVRVFFSRKIKFSTILIDG